MASDQDDAGAASVDGERWLVIGGRRWRRTDPTLPDDLVAALKSHLGRGRSGVGAAKRAGDEAGVARARERVGQAKHGLGERGPYWWQRAEPERIDAARAALAALDALDAAAAPAESNAPDAPSAPASE